VVLAGGGIALWAVGRRRGKGAIPGDAALLALSPEEEARLERLLASDPSVPRSEPRP
jgi:hypothetical protein